MNTLLIVALAVVAFCYCGGRVCPSVLKQNKEMLLGVLVGMALCSFAGLKLEGYTDDCDIVDTSKLLGAGQSCNNNCQCTADLLCIDGKCGRKGRTPSAEQQSRFNSEVDAWCGDSSNQGTAMYQMFCSGR